MTESVLAAGLARVRMAEVPTPFERAPGLSRLLGREVYLKRDDLSGLAFGGNKARQLEFIVGAALAEGADTLVTSAGVQSNLCRTLAGACARLGLRCVLLLRGTGREPLQANLLLDTLFGAEIEYIDTADPYDPAVAGRIAGIEERVRAHGGNPYVIHLPGRSGALGAAAAVPGGEELVRQCAALGVEPERVYVAAGSGLTLAGLTLAFRHLGFGARAVGVSVQQRAAFIKPLVTRRANEAADLLGLDTRVGEDTFDLDDGFIGPGYGRPSAASLAAVAKVARCDGVLLDPVYSGKCMAALLAHAAEGSAGAGALAFVHTGGAPAVFDHAPALAAART